jgi:HlyD family secretion protein
MNTGLLVLLVSCSTPEPAFVVEAASAGDLTMQVTAVGTLAAKDEVQIGSELSGEVLEVPVESNDAVQTGQTLARLDPVPFELAVSEAEAAVAGARASIDQADVGLQAAERDLHRNERLHEAGAVTTAQLDSVRTQRDLKQAQLALARAQLRQARVGLARAKDALESTVIRSPIEGVVLRRDVEPGQTLVSTLSAPTLFTVGADLSSLVAEVDIDEAEVARVTVGQPVSCTVSAWPDRTFSGRVLRVDLAPDPRSPVVVYVARVQIDNPDGALRSGMTVTATIETGKIDDAVLVPTAALRFTPDGSPARGTQVFVDAGTAVPRPVAVQVLGEDGRVAAVSGLEPGAMVITASRR